MGFRIGTHGQNKKRHLKVLHTGIVGLSDYATILYGFKLQNCVMFNVFTLHRGFKSFGSEV